MRPGIGVVVLILGFGLASAPAAAQHMHDAMPGMEHDAMAGHPLGFPHGRFGSGTSWLPDATVPRHLMAQRGSWMLMAHGAIFAGGIGMNGPRGDEKFVGPNMIMTMAEHGGASTLWRLSAMFSADAATVGGPGYPLLFQTGETWDGTALHDHQHPHNVFSELSVSMTRAALAGTALSLYAAPVGEPGLGPPAYPHRPVGGNDPLAPIGHHWQDATHIAYGVVTAGVERGTWRLEGSTFNGREPGENRAEIRPPEFDSFSGRVSFNPAASWSFQASHGYLHSPEEAHPDHDAWRTTASAIWVQPQENGRSFDLALVWGRNRVDRTDMDSWLIEGEWSHEDAITPYLRFEYVEKDAEELVLPASFDPERIFPLRQATLGAVVGLPFRGALSWGIGAQGVLSFVPRDLRPVYGDDPGGWAVFLRLRPRASAHGTHADEMPDMPGMGGHDHGAH